jgi:hypothetical protein
MGTMRQLLNLRETRHCLFVALMLFGLVGGCGPLIDIDVKVDNMAGSCPSGGSRGGPGFPAGGACSLNPTTPYNGSLIPANHKVCKNSSNQTINCLGTEMCTGGTSRVCNDPPGSERGTTCKSVWKQTSGTNGTCSCTHLY